MTAPTIDKEDEESVLDESEQTMRPNDVAFDQQRVNAWHPILDPLWVIVSFFYLGLILVPVGLKIDSLQSSVVEMVNTYDSFFVDDIDSPECQIGEKFNANQTCFLTFEAPRYMKPPILIHYQLENFHQNHRSYYQSRDAYQLLGRVGFQDPISRENCEPLNKLGNMTINPCGQIANTFFNDKFELIRGRDASGRPLEMIEEGIAWQSDLEFSYRQPNGFNYEECPAESQCDASCCDGDEWSCKTPYTDKNGNCYRYFYPEDETTQYLHETYPHIISPLEGVTNEHFVVWMKIATQPTFRKLYGWIDQPIAQGEKLVFEVNLNFVVTRFKGSKSLLVGTSNIFGGKSPYTASIFIGMGIYCLVVATFFSLKQKFRPRKLADPAYLHFKEE